jgi:hypothetical protein
MVDKTSEEIAALTAEVEKLTMALRGFKTRNPDLTGYNPNGKERRHGAMQTSYRGAA